MVEGTNVPSVSQAPTSLLSVSVVPSYRPSLRPITVSTFFQILSNACFVRMTSN